MATIEVIPVTCSRKGTYDAEVQIKTYENFDNPKYHQVLISSGHATSTEARDAAKKISDEIFTALSAVAMAATKNYKKAEA